jgi:hypothetical protein
MEISIKCDRCGKSVMGLMEITPTGQKYTGGFYDVESGYWRRFARREEKNICDECMFNDSRYQETYGIKSYKNK